VCAAPAPWPRLMRAVIYERACTPGRAGASGCLHTGTARGAWALAMPADSAASEPTGTASVAGPQAPKLSLGPDPLPASVHTLSDRDRLAS
jgi:hypothetical protein